MDDYIVPEKIRKELGCYLRNQREKECLGLNQLALKLDIVSSLLSKLENGKLLKINPFLLKKISIGLKIDYRELYVMIGYLNENHFKETYELKIKLEECEKKLSEATSSLHVSKNSGVIGNNNSHINIGNKTEARNDDFDISGLNDEKLKQLRSYVKFLKSE
ncbi:MAG: helix-turn-helix domain-containing protein [Fusobacteriaceae bacterium]